MTFGYVDDYYTDQTSGNSSNGGFALASVKSWMTDWWRTGTDTPYQWSCAVWQL